MTALLKGDVFKRWPFSTIKGIIMRTPTKGSPKNTAVRTPSLVVTATLFPAAASITSVACYILLSPPNPIYIINRDFISSISIVVGVISGLMTWLVGAWLYRPYITTERANVNEYQKIFTRFISISEMI